MLMDEILTRLREDLLKELGEYLICLLQTGSRVRGEAAEESDYDVFLVLKFIDSSLIERMQRVFSNYPNLSAYTVSEHEFKTLPRAQLLQLLYSEKLHGDIEYELPTTEEVRNYLGLMHREWLDRIRHYLIIPHPRETLAKSVHLAMKYANLYLSYTVFLETGKLPKTRKQITAYFNQRKKHNLGVQLLKILDGWDSRRSDVAQEPKYYLFLLEKFFRESRP
jgi:predicted nucleotidyltransferase